MTGSQHDGLDASALAVGDVVEVEIGAVAHGGHCVSRYDGRVIFVRHALPGERAKVRITDAKPGSFCRGDAVEILQADPQRVTPPCVHFRPNGCGGCDFQHASAGLQRELKAAVVAEQLRRLAGVDLPVTVEALPGNGFGWRTRVRWALDDEGRIGPRAVRSHEVIAVGPQTPCLIAAPGMSELAAVLEVPSGLRRGTSGGARGRRTVKLPEVTLTHTGDGSPLAVWAGQEAPEIRETVGGNDFQVAADGFWQVHPEAAGALSQAVVEALDGVGLAGSAAWDLYGGVGLFAAVLADLVGPDGDVVTVESDRSASELAQANLAGFPQVRVVAGRVEHALESLPDHVDAVVLDPPRSGAGRDLCAAIAAREPKVIVYVACDPAALGRDTAALMEAGYQLSGLRAFDAFPQTHHVECVARFTR